MRTLLLTLAIALLLSACGQSGRLVLPEKAARPAPPAAPAAAAPAADDEAAQQAPAERRPVTTKP